MTNLLFALVAAILLGLAIGLVRLNPRIVYLIASVYALTAWEFPNFGTIGTFGGTTITLGDGLTVALLFAGLFDLHVALRRFGAQALVAAGLLLALLAISLLQGIAQHGLGLAVNESRGFLYVLGILFWGVTRPWPEAEVRYAEKYFVLVQGLGLCVVTVYHVARFGLGGTADFILVNGELSQTGRPLVSGQAFLLVLCAILALRIWKRDGNAKYLTLFVCFMAVAAISQQRTVWLAMGAVVLLLIFRGPKELRNVFLAISTTLVLVFAVVSLSRSSLDGLIAEFTGSASNSGTYSARLTSWSGLIASSLTEGPVTVLFGAPFGHGYGRFEGVGRWVVFAPHNWYVTVYLRTGLLGLFSLIMIFIPRVVVSLRSGRDVYLASILLCFLVYGWTYSWQWWTCLPLVFAFLQRDFPFAEQPQPQLKAEALRSVVRSR